MCRTRTAGLQSRSQGSTAGTPDENGIAPRRFQISLTFSQFLDSLLDVNQEDIQITQLQQVAKGLGETFAPFCEVVLHDLRDPARSIVSIENNLSGRGIGDPTTELGLARIADGEHPQVIANYANHLADGRPVKSTSIGIKGADGQYIAALCLNIDLTVFNGLTNVLNQFARIDPEASLSESLDPGNADIIRGRIDAFAAQFATTPRSLTVMQRRELTRELKTSGCFRLRNSVDVIAQHLGVSRATVYADVK